jgi:protease II
MRTFFALATLAVLSCDSHPPAGTARVNVQEKDAVKEDFEKENAKWKFALGHWERRKSGDGWVLAKTGDHKTYNVALLEDQRYSDVDVRVRYRPVSGEVDASGGIIFRAQDAENYYVVRANALEDNFRLYKTVQGRRTQIAGTRVTTPPLGAWHTLRLVAKGDHIQAYSNDELLIDHHDDTFKEGWVGLWTKADSVTEFDDLAVTDVAGR